MKTWERQPCENGKGFYEKLCINNDPKHYMSVTLWDFTDTFFVRYVRDGFTKIKDSIKAKNIEEAKDFIIQETLKQLNGIARYYDNLYEQVNKEVS